MTMIFIKGYAGETFSSKIEQHDEHGKYCGRVYYNGELELGPWFGWCDTVEQVEAWIEKKKKEVY
jgi:hypothetical protein